MQDLSLHLLDLAQNSIAAGALHIVLQGIRMPGRLKILVEDDGCGMTKEGHPHKRSVLYYPNNPKNRIPAAVIPSGGGANRRVVRRLLPKGGGHTGGCCV